MALLSWMLLLTAALAFFLKSPFPRPEIADSTEFDEFSTVRQDGSRASSIDNISGKKVSSAWLLIEELKKHNLWEIKRGEEISPFLLSAFPSDLDTLTVCEKKKVFLNALLPAALMANQDILKERQRLLAILGQIPLRAENLFFGQKNSSTWQPYLNSEELSFIKDLTRKYRSKKATQLLRRVNVIPVSLILAQGALESSWGTSRFSREGNSLFGLWTWNNTGIIPLDRDPGKTHRVEAYNSILDSLQKYLLTLNRLDAYTEFRIKRTENLDPFDLAEGLRFYSERGEDYVNDIKRVISSNGLTVYDTVLFAENQISLSEADSPGVATETSTRM